MQQSATPSGVGSAPARDGLGERRPSSTDVARLAGVSQSAVSRTFTPGASVSARTRDRVLAAAAQLGYHPNLLPRMVMSDRTNIVAIVTGDLVHAFYARVVDELARTFRALGKLCVLVRVASDQALDEVVADLARYRVDHVVSALSVRSAETARLLDTLRTPVIQLAQGHAGRLVRTVTIDNYAAGARAARLLIARGASEFAYVGGVDSPAQDGRQRGFVDALSAAGKPVRIHLADDYRHADGWAAADALAARPPDGLFCANDLLAFGVLDRLRAAGWQVPGDVRLIGFDNLEQAEWPGYALTSFDQDVPALVAAVIDALGEDAPAERILPARLVERASTRPPAA